MINQFTALRLMVTLLALLALICPRIAVSESSDQMSLPFPVGEKLFYEVKWGVIPAAYATLEVMPQTKDNDTSGLHFVMTARTNEFADLFYKYRNRIDSFTDTSLTRSLGFSKREQERSRIRNEDVRFDWDKMETRITGNEGEERRGVELVPGAFDPLSIFYAFRIRALEVGKELDVPVSDGRKLAQGTARVVDREEIVVNEQHYDCFVVEPDLKDLGGVFRRSPEATMHIWVTADELRLPVRVRSKIIVGYFTADLVAVE
jgi:hypothetical protein